MGDVICTITVMPKGVDVDIDKLQTAIKDKIGPEKIEVKPVAFGLKSIEVKKVLKDGGGQKPEDLEEAIRGLDDVENAECTGVDLL